MTKEILSCVEINPAMAPLASVIWLHGLGADGHDFADLVPQLNLPTELPLRFVFPHAPIRPITINNGYSMRAWYDIPSMDFASRADEAGVRISEQQIQMLIEREHAQGIAYSRIILAGFSQGGAMALHCGLRFPERLAGILALSTYLPLAGTVAAEASVANKNIPIWMAHGNEDAVIPLNFAQTSGEILKKLDYKIDFHLYSMPHSVCSEEINDIGKWLKQLFL